MTSTAEILKRLQEKAMPSHLEGMAKFGMAAEKRLGVSVPEMRRIAADAIRKLESAAVKEHLKR